MKKKILKHVKKVCVTSVALLYVPCSIITIMVLFTLMMLFKMTAKVLSLAVDLIDAVGKILCKNSYQVVPDLVEEMTD